MCDISQYKSKYEYLLETVGRLSSDSFNLLFTFLARSYTMLLYFVVKFRKAKSDAG